MLSFQVRDAGQSVQIYCDRGGMSVLLRSLAELIGAQAEEHLLISPACGGSDLHDTTPFGEEAMSEVRIYYVEAGTN